MEYGRARGLGAHRTSVLMLLATVVALAWGAAASSHPPPHGSAPEQQRQSPHHGQWPFGGFGRSSQIQVDVDQAGGIQGAHHRQAEQPQASHTLSISHSQARRSLVRAGEPSRLHRAMQKLLRGQPATVTIVGGSISVGHGSIDLRKSYANRVFAWLNSTFPDHGRLTLHNGAFGGSTSEYMSLCLQEHVPLNSDIVLVDYAVNDAAIHATADWQSDARRAFERLLRQLLDYPHRPAVILLELYSYLFSGTEGSFFKTGEDVHSVFAQYYDLTWLSARNAFYHAFSAGLPGFHLNISATPEDFYYDTVHPNAYGHQKIADIVINFLQHSIADVSSLSWPAATLSNEGGTDHLPSPMLEGNHHQSSALRCLHAEQLKGAAVGGSGFEWGFDQSFDSRKYGFIATEPGSVLKLQVNTTSEATSTGLVDVYVGHLRSYGGMGKFGVRCIEGCRCAPSLMSGHHTDRTSQRYFTTIPAVTQHERCVLAVVVAEETDSGGHRVRIDGLVVSPEESRRRRSPINRMPSVY